MSQLTLILAAHWRKVALLAGGALVVVFWLVFAVESLIEQRLTTIRAVNRTPPLLNGLQVRLDRYVHPGAVSSDVGKVYLWFVSDDSCTYSRADVSQWRQLIETIPRMHPVELILLTLNGTEVPQQISIVASRMGFRYTTIAIAPSARSFLALETGIRETPRVLLTDHTFRVLWSTTRIERASADVLVGLLDSMHGT